MRTSRIVHIVSAHAEGEVGDVIVGGVAPPPGETLWDQRTFIAEDQTLRNFVLNEPRGGVFRHINLLVPAKHLDAQFGFIIMEPTDYPPMSGSNAICVVSVLLETGMVEMREPETRLTLDTPGGVIEAVATHWRGEHLGPYGCQCPADSRLALRIRQSCLFRPRGARRCIDYLLSRNQCQHLFHGPLTEHHHIRSLGGFD